MHLLLQFLGNDLGCAPGSVMNYDSEGNCFGSISEVPPKARKLRWDVPQECQNVMQKCLKVGAHCGILV